jgi:hypothetical protein
MKSSTKSGIAVLALCLGFSWGCGHPANLPAATGATSDPSQKLPFNREPKSAGISPTASLISSLNRLPEGTPLIVSLEHSLSSASAHASHTFTAVLDEPIVLDGQTVVPRGAPLTGRVLDAKSAARTGDPGYLRISLETITIAGKQFPIATSSFFAKAGSHEDRASPIPEGSIMVTLPVPRETVLTPDRRLSFRLTQQVDLK